jgi:hypothetical protein
VTPPTIRRVGPYPEPATDPLMMLVEVGVLLLIIVALIAGAIMANPDPAHASSWQTVNASMYGGSHERDQESLHDGFGKAKSDRNCIAMRTRDFGALYMVVYFRHGRTYRQLCVVADYGPAKWTGRKVDILRGGAKRLAFPGTGRVRIKRVGKLPKRCWRKFRNYKTLAECKRKLRWR